MENIQGFLSQKFGISALSPKEVFRELRKNKLITDEETVLYLKMADDRNEVIHTYNQDFSNELYAKIRESYYELLAKIFHAIKNNK